MLLLMAILFCSASVNASQVAVQKTNFTLKKSVAFKTEICFVTYECVNNRSGSRITRIEQYYFKKGASEVSYLGDSTTKGGGTKEERNDMCDILEKAREKFCAETTITQGEDSPEQLFNFNRADLPGEEEKKEAAQTRSAWCMIQ